MRQRRTHHALIQHPVLQLQVRASERVRGALQFRSLVRVERRHDPKFGACRLRQLGRHRQLFAPSPTCSSRVFRTAVTAWPIGKQNARKAVRTIRTTIFA